MNERRLAGFGLLGFPLAVQVPFSLLAARFSYPDILVRGADEVLTRFHAGGTAMVATWYAYALCTPGLALVAVAMPAALGSRGLVARLSVVAGVLASVVQLLGLLRWTFVVPFLAERWVASPADHATLELLYEAQHRLFGVMLGEHVGQLFMAAWTACVSVLARDAKPLRWLGVVAALLFFAGLVHKPLALVAFITWSVWAVALGVWLLRHPGGGE